MQIYIISGIFSAQDDYIEVFDAKNKTIEKVVDDQNNWIKVPEPGKADLTCIVPMIKENAFAILGGLQRSKLGIDIWICTNSGKPCTVG